MNVMIAVVLAFQLIELQIEGWMFVCWLSGTKRIGLSIEDAYEIYDCSGTCISINRIGNSSVHVCLFCCQVRNASAFQ